jgi:hypothetical protein
MLNGSLGLKCPLQSLHLLAFLIPVTRIILASV